MSGASVPSGYCSASLRFSMFAMIAPCEIASDHQSLAGVLGYLRLQIGDPLPNRLIEGEVEEPRELPQRLVGPRRAVEPPDARWPNHSQDEAKDPGDRPELHRRVTAMYSMSSSG